MDVVCCILGRAWIIHVLQVLILVCVFHHEMLILTQFLRWFMCRPPCQKTCVSGCNYSHFSSLYNSAAALEALLMSSSSLLNCSSKCHPWEQPWLTRSSLDFHKSWNVEKIVMNEVRVHALFRFFFDGGGRRLTSHFWAPLLRTRRHQFAEQLSLKLQLWLSILFSKLICH